MGQGPEARLKTSIHRYIKKGDLNIHIEGMCNPYSKGTPDVYYEGTDGCLWVEYKATKKNLGGFTPSSLLSPMQHSWLERANRNNVNTALIVKGSKGTYIYGGVNIFRKCDYTNPTYARSNEYAANWIISILSGEFPICFE